MKTRNFGGEGGGSPNILLSVSEHACRRLPTSLPRYQFPKTAPPYCTGGGVMPMNTVPRNFPVGPNFQLNSAKPARAQAWQPLSSG